MSKVVVDKIKRLVGKLHSTDEIEIILAAVRNRRLAVEAKTQLHKEEEAFQRVKAAAPGDVLVACRRSNYSEIGDVFEVIKVAPRVRRLVAYRRVPRVGCYRFSYAMGEVYEMDLRKDPPPEIAAIALSNKIGGRLGPEDSKPEYPELDWHRFWTYV